MTGMVLQDGVVFDSELGTSFEGHVVIEGSRIVDVLEAAVPRSLPDSFTRVLLAGRTVLPGLIDAHVHVTITDPDIDTVYRQPATYRTLRAAAALRDMLERGFTTVRDA